MNILDEHNIIASRNEVEMAKLEGVDFLHNVTVTEIVPNGLVLSKLEWIDNKISLVGEPFRLSADNVIISIGQIARTNLAQTAPDMKLSNKELLIVEMDGKTTKTGVFAAGDVSTGGKTVVSAVAGAKVVYDSIKEYCFTVKKTPALKQ